MICRRAQRCFTVRSSPLARLERTFMGPSEWLTLLFGVLGLPGAALSMLLLYEWGKKRRESKRKPE